MVFYSLYMFSLCTPLMIGCTLVQMYSELETYIEELVPASQQSDCFVCIQSLRPELNADEEGWRYCDRTGYVSFCHEYAPFSYSLFYTVH